MARRKAPPAASTKPATERTMAQSTLTDEEHRARMALLDTEIKHQTGDTNEQS